MMRRDTAALWAETRPYLWPEPLVLVSFAPDELPHLLAVAAPLMRGFSALVVERDELSLTIHGEAWLRIEPAVTARAIAGPYRALTFDLSIGLGVCGYLLPAAERLAAAGISIVPQCAFDKDHLLVAADRADEALAILNGLVDEARVLVREDAPA